MSSLCLSQRGTCYLSSTQKVFLSLSLSVVSSALVSDVHKTFEMISHIESILYLTNFKSRRFIRKIFLHCKIKNYIGTY